MEFRGLCLTVVDIEAMDKPSSNSKKASGRLPSFKSQRDLTLGGSGSRSGSQATAKKFVPNLNVQRNKKEDTKQTSSSADANKVS